MFWTKNKPNSPGLYWIKFLDENNKRQMVISRVAMFEEGLKYLTPPNHTDLQWSNEAITVPEESNILQFPTKKPTEKATDDQD